MSPRSQSGTTTLNYPKEGKVRLVSEEPSPGSPSTNYRASSEDTRTVCSPLLNVVRRQTYSVDGDSPVWDCGGLGWRRAHSTLGKAGLSPRDLLLHELTAEPTTGPPFSVPYLPKQSFLCNPPSLAPMYAPYLISVKINRREEGREVLCRPYLLETKALRKFQKGFGWCKQFYLLPQ